jgi:glycosyltransferase involved in cell wall biosynthesis
MKISLLISTYNWVNALNLVFEAVKSQTRLPDEILVADDGSHDDTRQLIDKFRSEISVPVKHIWQEDKGFRKASILNQAIAQSNACYIIQIDGDCIPERHLVEDHLFRAKPGIYLYGSRVDLRKEYETDILQKQKTDFHFFSKEIKKHRTRTLRINLFSHLYRPNDGVPSKTRGCNLSFWRNDFIAINGYNEDFEGWGREDSDMAIRLSNNCIKGKKLRYGGIVYHLYHPTASMDNFEQNDRIEKTSKMERVIQCENGIGKYL